MKYIDADLLRKEINRLKDEYTDIAIDSRMGWVNANYVVDDLEQLQSQIDSLQQEQQEVDLEKEISDFKRVLSIYPGGYTLDEIARHFYELGKNSK